MKSPLKGFVLWFTGLSGAGKTTIAEKVYQNLKREGYRVEYLDGDIIRKNLSKDLSFSKKDRITNLERVAFVASLLSRNKIGVIAAFISPYQKQRNKIRRTCSNFIEVYVNTSLKVCEKRDDKGLYKKARRGIVKNFTGISDPYEAPKVPEIIICGDRKERINPSVRKIIRYLKTKALIQK